MPIDSTYNTVTPGHLEPMLQSRRYLGRSTRFDEIIARTEEHYWNPDDRDYIDFAEPYSVDLPILPGGMVPELHSAVADKLDEGQRIRLVNETARWMISNILHGEQAALNLSANLCDMLLDPGAQEYAANQAREEARHVRAFTNYMRRRFGGEILPVGETLGRLLGSLVESRMIYEKVVGMQMLVEGLAMGAFATLHLHGKDPLLRRLCQLVMTDEAFHHRFGKLWAQDTVPSLTAAERDVIEDWAAQCFTILLFNLVNPEQKQVIYQPLGLDWHWVSDAVREAFTDNQRRRQMQESTNIFRVLIKTLLKAGLVTDRTRSLYAAWVDMEELAIEGDRMVGDDIAEAGIGYLREVNAGKRKLVRRIG